MGFDFIIDYMSERESYVVNALSRRHEQMMGQLNAVS